MENMKRKKDYEDVVAEKYREEKFYEILHFTKEELKPDNLSNLEQEVKGKVEGKDYRIWLLFGKHENEKEWECLQVAQTKNNLINEIKEDIGFMAGNYDEIIEKIPEEKQITKNTAFYNNAYIMSSGVKDKRKYLYSKMAKEFDEFIISSPKIECFIMRSKEEIKTDDENNMINIALYPYVEAKIAYLMLAKYWNYYRSGVDGQTIMLFIEKLNQKK